MSSVTIPSYLTQEEPLALERKMTTKRGYFSGQILRMVDTNFSRICYVYLGFVWGRSIPTG